jgi:hypothetical protein
MSRIRQPGGMQRLRSNVRIAGDAPAQTLREIAEWADAHSPVGCTVRNAPAVALEVQTL